MTQEAHVPRSGRGAWVFVPEHLDSRFKEFESDLDFLSTGSGRKGRGLKDRGVICHGVLGGRERGGKMREYLGF